MMNIEVSSAAAATIWELLCSSSQPIDAQEISRQAGLPLVRVSSMLGKFALVGLVDRTEVASTQAQAPVVPVAKGRKAKQEVAPVQSPGFLFQARRSMDAMTYATAVEIGIPLFLLEKTVSLSNTDKKEAFRLAETGQVDRAREEAKEKRRQEIAMQLRGRAATKAAATDLAKLVQDVSRVAPVAEPLDQEIKKVLPPDILLSPSTVVRENPTMTKVRMEIARQAAQALESLILAMEKAR